MTKDIKVKNLSQNSIKEKLKLRKNKIKMHKRKIKDLEKELKKSA